MFALIEIAGIQFEVSEKKTVRVPLLKGNPGDKVEFNTILAAGDDNAPQVGAPYIEGAVGATIIEHGKDDKILIFHKKKTKGYRKLNGHRQNFTKIEITDIKLGKTKKPRARKKAEVVEEVQPVAENNE